jgi:hypothetical protein
LAFASGVALVVLAEVSLLVRSCCELIIFQLRLFPIATSSPFKPALSKKFTGHPNIKGFALQAGERLRKSI